MASNDRVGIAFRQPRDLMERVGLAEKCTACLEISMPVLVDELSDRVGHLYSGMPDRMYVIDREGRVAFKSGRGPFGFKAGEMEQSLAMLLLDEAGQERLQGCLPVLPNSGAWKRLPVAEKGAGQPLPTWARALADPLPATTAAMLELDYLQRTSNPLPPVLRGEVRWVAARANRCAYSEACAAADLRRAGVNVDRLALAKDDFKNLPADERATLSFARKLTLAAHTVTDAEVAELRRIHGDDKLVALVLLLAYANFQDRLLLTLNVPIEPNGPLPALDVRFAAAEPGQAVPPRQTSETRSARDTSAKLSDPQWLAFDINSLRKAMTEQSEREPRIPVPTWEEVRKRMPGDTSSRKPLKIRWSLVCLGYQPELANAWSACTRAFAREAKQDRVFEETLFWVVTRSLQCFY